MVLKDKSFCTLLDELGKHKDTKAIVPLITKLCLSSLFSNRLVPRTFVMPDSKGLKKIEGMSDEKAKEQIRRQLLKSSRTPEFLKDKDGFLLFSSMNDEYKVVKVDKTSITVSGAGEEIKLKYVLSGPKFAIYTASELLPAHPSTREKPKHKGKSKSPSPGKKSSSASKKSSSASKKSSSKKSSKKSSSRKQKGGGMNYFFGDNDFGQYPNIRRYMAEQYQSRFPLQQFPLSNKLNFANQLLAGLLMYINEQDPALKDTYGPLISDNPLASLEVLTQMRNAHMLQPNQLLIGDNIFRGFMDSPMFLSGDSDMLGPGFDLMQSLVQPFVQPGMSMMESPYIMNSLIGEQRGFLSNMLQQDPLRARRQLVAVYRKVKGEPNRFNPGTSALYEKVYGTKLGEGFLRDDLMRFMSRSLSPLPWNNYNQAMDTLFAKPVDHTLDTILEHNMFQNNYTFDNDILGNFLQSNDFLFPGLGGLGNFDGFDGQGLGFAGQYQGAQYVPYMSAQVEDAFDPATRDNVQGLLNQLNLGSQSMYY